MQKLVFWYQALVGELKTIIEITNAIITLTRSIIKRALKEGGNNKSTKPYAS